MQALICIVSFSIPGSFVEKQGDLRGKHEIGDATHADFVLAVYLFWFILPCFLKFLFLFFKNIKLSQQLFICVCSSFMDIKLLSSGFKITEPQTKKTSFSNTIYIYKIVIDIFFLVIICKLFSFRIFLSAFFHPNFVIRIRYPHPSSAGIRSSFYRHPFSTGFTNHFNRKWSF